MLSNIFVSGETAALGLTNGVYACCKSFRTADDPIATLAMLHGSIPTSVIGAIINEQQELWVSPHTFEVAEKLAPGERWPRHVKFADRVRHPNGHRYMVMQNREGHIFYGEGQADLPVFKENSAHHRKLYSHNSVTNLWHFFGQGTGYTARVRTSGVPPRLSPAWATW